ncbi:MAG: choice-of-anchor J domain-containing protein [Candidatus Cloacimonadaceae bacterium]|nr:choice-of-anchor J domain-containing protein [Candidatus Cloacimonadaceae bacterium]
MKKLTLLTLMLLFIATCIFGVSVNTQTAERVAGNFVHERLGANYTVATSKYLESGYRDSYIYVITLNPTGFVLVAADDAAIPIIGYSTRNNWNEYSIPEQMQEMLKSWNDQMHAIITQRMSANVEISQLWSRYNVPFSSFSPNRDFRNVSPLMTSLWGQGTYYNAQCPSGTPVGCVATAMAQIMRYWRFPTVGQGSFSYNCPPYGIQSADFGSTTYNWAAMPNTVSSANVSVATISRHAGVAVSMQYAPSGSGAYSSDVPGAMISYFRYANTALLRNKSSFSTENWDTMMRGELDNARPIYYSGSSAASGGHAFVLDGYQGTNSFHVNWGWNGSYNGYFTLAALNPGTDNFNSGQQAVIGIRPTTMSLNLSEGFEGTTFPPTGWTVTASTFIRSATSFITGAFSANYTTGNITGAAATGKQLRTPLLTVNATSAPFTFKAKLGATARGETIRVGYSTSATGPYTYFGTNAVLAATATTYSYAVTSLTPNDYYFMLETLSTVTNVKTWIIDDVTGPALWINPNPIASINMTSWAAGAMAPGDAAYSGNIFQLSNTGQGNLTISGITNLSATEFSSNFNSSVSLVNGQVLEFGFGYEPLNYGIDNQSFVITTNGGTITINLSGSAASSKLSDSFESYNDFTLSFPPWTTYDGDGQATGGIGGVTFPNSGYTGAWIIFNPANTTPPTGAAEPRTGAKYAMSMYNTSAAANNDWMISPVLSLAGSPSLSFWAKSYSASYLETLKVYYSTTNNTAPGSFTLLATQASVPTTWTQYTYVLPAACADNSTVFVAIANASVDKFMLFIDDVVVNDNSTPPPPTFGNVSGHVYRFGTSTPIVNAMVTAGTKVAYTNFNGFYQINNLLVGTHSLTCNAAGQFYFTASVSGVVVTQGNTTTQNFGLKWGELTASPTSVAAALYQGENGSATVTLANPGGTANTSYAGYVAKAVRSGSIRRLDNSPKKRSPGFAGAKIPPLDAPAPDRTDGWFGYATFADAQYYTAAITERGNYFIIDDIAMMDGVVTVSQLRHYFYNPSTSLWTTTTNKFKWKVYTVSSTGTVTLVHTSAEITLPTTTPSNSSLLSTYTIPTALTIPLGTDFMVTILPTSATTGKPQSLATGNSTDNGYFYDATNGWQALGMDLIMDAYVSGNSWMDGLSFSGTITPAGNVSIPLNFNTVGITAGTKLANMYIYNNSNYVAPSVGDRGDVMVVPISLTVTVATTPVAVLNTTTWTTNANTGSPSTSGAVFQLKNVGPGNLTITSATGLAGTPFTTSFDSGISLPQNGTHNFGFTFSPTANGIFNATFTIITNGGTKTVTLRGYANYVAEGFEGANFPPDGWLALDQDGDTHNWYRYTATGAPYAGTACAASASWVAARTDSAKDGIRPVLTPNNWLITPRLAISNGDILSWWVGAQDPAWPAEYYSVLISTTSSAISSFTTTLFSETLVNGNWLSRSVNLSAYAGQSVFIAFRHHNCTDQFVLKLDDVLMPPLAAPLVYGNITGRVRRAGTDINIQGATVTISGRTSLTGEDGNYTINNVVVDTYPLTATAPGYVAYAANVTIPANSTLTHNIFMNYAQFSTPTTTFNLSVAQGQSTSTTLNLGNVGNVSVNWTADSGIWGGDSFPAGPFYKDFEDLDLSGWVGSTGPNSQIYTGYGYNSPNVWVFASYQTTSTQWIATPKIRVQTGDNLSFWYKQFNLSDETFSVMISTTTNEAAAFTTTLATLGPLTDTNWAQFNQSLNAYAGMDIYISFFYPRTDGYQYGYIMLDNIGGGTAILPPTEWLSSTLSGTLAPGQTIPFTLNVNAGTPILPVGSYTAQTWIFGTAMNSPYKLYVNLTVTPPLGINAPENVIVLAYNDYMELAWDPVDAANTYKVYICDTPNGIYQLILTTESNSAEFTWAQISALGFSGGANRAFFKIAADTAPARGRQITSKVSSQTLDKLYEPNRTKVLYPVE